jgi:hypothetical protein
MSCMVQEAKKVREEQLSAGDRIGQCSTSDVHAAVYVDEAATERQAVVEQLRPKAQRIEVDVQAAALFEVPLLAFPLLAVLFYY